jgi:hypothetical protein
VTEHRSTVDYDDQISSLRASRVGVVVSVLRLVAIEPMEMTDLRKTNITAAWSRRALEHNAVLPSSVVCFYGGQSQCMVEVALIV